MYRTIHLADLKYIRQVIQHTMQKNMYRIMYIFVMFGGCIFQQTVGITMSTDCVPLLADLFLYSYEEDFIYKTKRNQADPTIAHSAIYIRGVATLGSSRHMPIHTVEFCFYKSMLYFPTGIRIQICSMIKSIMHRSIYILSE